MKEIMKDSWRYWVTKKELDSNHTEIPSAELMRMDLTTLNAINLAHKIPYPFEDRLFEENDENLAGISYIFAKTHAWKDFGQHLQFIVARQPPFNF